ncbi:hypothetical protein [Geoalkalibacter subterraneus]|uniref:Uncharacterized protein n=1 Tax=Geoalkalibacter subterraneus TaxID=483547 RepID=A0A0B5FU94_9BACT|nr:hypothetical protein [Geoalkalibacter subterraneus]AJF08224.1 hypothetical protein GSUB_17210 [Geoalkalibacter subterraneus]
MSELNANIFYTDFEAAPEVGALVNTKALAVYAHKNGLEQVCFEANSEQMQMPHILLEAAGVKQYYRFAPKASTEKQSVYVRLDEIEGLKLKTARMMWKHNQCKCKDAPISLEEEILLDADFEHPEIDTHRYLWLGYPCEACGKKKVHAALFCPAGACLGLEDLIERALFHQKASRQEVKMKLRDLLAWHTSWQPPEKILSSIVLPQSPFVWF